MAKLNNKRALTALALLAGVVLVLGGGLMASNMGFKLNRALSSGGNSGTNSVGLPYNRQVGIDQVSDLFGDIQPDNSFTDLQTISRFLPASDSFQAYTYAQPDFNLTVAEGYLVKMGAPVNYIIVGSHDPGAVIPLNPAGVGSAAGNNFFAPPYHATASMSSELFAELNFTNVQTISRFLPASDSFQAYTLLQPDWPIVPGEAYMVKMANAVAYSPSHY